MKKKYKVTLFVAALPFLAVAGFFVLVTMMFGPGIWTLDRKVEEHRLFFDAQSEKFFSGLAADLTILMDESPGGERRFSKSRRDPPIPESLSHLEPQSVVVRKNSVSIILVNMMDTGAILNAQRFEDMMAITGSFGDYGHSTFVQRTYYRTPPPNKPEVGNGENGSGEERSS